VRFISVVIPAHNEQRYLPATLQALSDQDYKWREVIVVANGCTDCTASVARGRCDRLIVLSQKGLGVARNLGARMARGELLVFLDADTLLAPSALRRIAQEFNRQCAFGTLRGVPNSSHLPYRLLYAAKNFLHRWALHPGSSGIIVCWKEHFVQCGGFDEHLQVRENSELSKRLLRYGSYVYINHTAAVTSMRRYERRGLPAMFLLWSKLWLRSLFGDLRRQSYEAIR
jgi:glycosyltransferase involved in cell wall biosynthesis